MVPFCEFCKLLNNPMRMAVLKRVYQAKDGMNVGILADELHLSGLGISGVSQYLKQLEQLGILHRSRAGRFVNYCIDIRCAATEVKEAFDIWKTWQEAHEPDGFPQMLGILMNPFRARVVGATAKNGVLSAMSVCAKLIHQQKHLKRDLKQALDAGILVEETGCDGDLVYRYHAPTDMFSAQLIDIVVKHLI